MTPADLRALAARVETEAPSRALDADIAVAARAIPDHAPRYLREWGGSFAVVHADVGRIAAINDAGEASLNWESPRYTTSVDDALGLMPDGWRYLAKQDPHDHRWEAHSETTLKWQRASAYAEAPARAALALRCRAVDLEQEAGR